MTPVDCAQGTWRSPNVEQLQLKRRLDIAFVFNERAGGLVATGEDADTPFVPDQMCKIVLSKIVWKDAGINHGKTCYEAFERPVEDGVAAAPPQTRLAAWLANPAFTVAVGAVLGAVVVLAAQRSRA